MPSRRVLALSSALLIAAAGAQAAGCESDGPGVGGGFTLDGAAFDTGRSDGSALPQPDATPGADAEAGAEAGPAPPASTTYGVWSGTMIDADGTAYPMLAGLTRSAEGQITGVVEYPTLGCGGTLRLLTSYGSDGGSAPALRLHELDRTGRCVADGDVLVTLQGDGGLHYVWDGGSDFQFGEARLTREGRPGPAGAFAATTWADLADGGVDGGGLHPFIGVIANEEPDSGAAGVFSLLASTDNGGITCGATWSVLSRTATELVLREDVRPGAIGCVGGGVVRLTVAGNDRSYERRDAGDDAGSIDGGDVSLVLRRIGP